MKRILIFVFILLNYNCISQSFFGSKNKKITIVHTYSLFINDGDSIKYGRTSEDELEKLSGFSNLKLNVMLMESLLNDKQSGAKGFELSFKQMLEELRSLSKKHNIDLNLTDYETEFQFYQNHKIKTKAELEQDAYQTRLKANEEKRKIEYLQKREEEQKLQRKEDSIGVIMSREKHIKDSIDDKNYKAELKKQAAQEEIKRRALEQQKQKDVKAKQEREKERLRELIEKYGSKNGELIFNKKLEIGWSKEMCIDSWGKPKDINTTTTLGKVSEQWVYSLKKYLYFENGILTAIQN